MTPREAVAMLAAAFRREEVSHATEELYVKEISNIPPTLLFAAIHRIIHTVKFFPSISEIQNTAAEIAGILPPSAEEALAIVRKADISEMRHNHDGSYGYLERYWDWPEEASDDTVEIICKALEKAGKLYDAEDKPVFAWHTDFKRVYEVVVEKERPALMEKLSIAVLPMPKKELTE